MSIERRRTALVLAWAAGAVALDQLTKTVAERNLTPGDPIDLLWTLRLNLVYNSGGAFSIGSEHTPYIAAAASVVLAVLLLSSRRAMSALSAVGLGLVIGGAAGNLVDRLLRDNAGAVIDFFDLQWWPIFNVADVSLSVGAVLLVAAAFLDERRAAGGSPAEQQQGESAPGPTVAADDG